jgi:hypothetical protein
MLPVQSTQRSNDLELISIPLRQPDGFKTFCEPAEPLSDVRRDHDSRLLKTGNPLIYAFGFTLLSPVARSDDAFDVEEEERCLQILTCRRNHSSISKS